MWRDERRPNSIVCCGRTDTTYLIKMIKIYVLSLSFVAYIDNPFTVLPHNIHNHNLYRYLLSIITKTKIDHLFIFNLSFNLLYQIINYYNIITDTIGITEFEIFFSLNLASSWSLSSFSIEKGLGTRDS